MSNSSVKNMINVSDLPTTIEEKTFENWTIRCSSSHILPSKCTDPCTDDKKCTFCIYSSELEMQHLPEMVFPCNKLEIVYKGGSRIEFNALDALKMVKNENKSVKIACSEDWKRSRQDTGLVDKTIGDFDWTYSTDYTGTLEDWASREETDEAIDTNRLKEKEQILYYNNLTLFEDELHDNGIALCSVRIRVMPSGFFVLLRYFLRVDEVILSVNDTRMYHDFTKNYVLVEFTHREAKVSELRIPLFLMNKPDEVTPLLPLQVYRKEKLVLPERNSRKDNASTSDSV